jgi:hypothetical protein
VLPLLILASLVALARWPNTPLLPWLPSCSVARAAAQKNRGAGRKHPALAAGGARSPVPVQAVSKVARALLRQVVPGVDPPPDPGAPE